MKLKNFIVESFEAEVKKFFKVSGKISQTPEGIVVDGDLSIISTKTLSEIPWKIHEVTGEFSVENSKLSSLKNFPDRAEVIIVSGNAELTSLAGGEHIICEEFDASNTGITDLTGCPSATIFNFRNCPNLRSTKGLNTNQPIRMIELDRSPNLEDITELTKKIGGSKLGRSTVDFNPAGSFLRLVLVNGLPGYLNFDIVFPKSSDRATQKTQQDVQNIFAEFKGKGLSSAIELIRRYHNEGGDISAF